MILLLSLLIFLAGFAGLHLLGAVLPWAYYVGGIMMGAVVGAVVVVWMVGEAESRGRVVR